MNINDLSEQQQRALLDLAMLAMYADGHLTSAEDDRVNRLLGAMGFTTDYDRGKAYDASIARVSRHAQKEESARAHALSLTQSFSTREQRRLANDLLDDLITSDSQVSLQESSLLSVVREALQR